MSVNRITERFDMLRNSGRKGFIPFITAGDPELETSLMIAEKLAELGADVIELGVPFSDPMADGPTIQLSSQRALENGISTLDILELIRRFRARYETPIVLFSYLNPLLAFGIESLAEQAAAVGIDGILVTDAVDNEAATLRVALRSYGIELISLIAPTTSDERLEMICQNAGGFIYAVSRAGITGARSDLSSAAQELVQRARRYTDLPIAVGFGVSTMSHIEDVWRFADAAVVGSAIVERIAAAGPGEHVCEVEQFVRSLLPNLQMPAPEFKV